MVLKRSPVLRGELRLDAPLRGLNSWRVGGCAERLFRPADLDDLVTFLSGSQASEPVTWLGLGTNILVRDGGIRGTVIALHGALDKIVRISPAQIRAQAGVPCAKLARTSVRWGLTGIEFLAGIPGTVGGALAMNAGAFGAETWGRVLAVETLDARGGLHTRGPDEFEVGYRTVQASRREWFVSAIWALDPGDPENGLVEIRRLLGRRAEAQPTGMPSCGSVFRNPAGDHAGRLIEAAGLKGQCVGGACVSERHANFIVNTGTACAADIEALIERVRTEVEARFGLLLVPEVRILGEASR